MADRSVNAFQFDHPELHRYYQKAAQTLLSELNGAVKGGDTHTATGEYGQTYAWRSRRMVSPRIAELLNSGMSYAETETALDAIVHDRGQENYANAKRVELVLDDMLTNGYQDGERFVPANTAYLAAKDSIAGSRAEVRGHRLDDVDAFDTPGDARAGAVNTEFDAMQAQSDEFHPVNPNSAQRIQAEQRRAPSEVPTVNPETGRSVEKTVSTILNSPLTSPEMASVYENAIAGGAFDYDVVTDRGAMQQAQRKIARDGWRETADAFVAKSDLGQRINSRAPYKACGLKSCQNQHQNQHDPSRPGRGVRIKICSERRKSIKKEPTAITPHLRSQRRQRCAPVNYCILQFQMEYKRSEQ